MKKKGSQRYEQCTFLSFSGGGVLCITHDFFCSRDVMLPEFGFDISQTIKLFSYPDILWIWERMCFFNFRQPSLFAFADLQTDTVRFLPADRGRSFCTHLSKAIWSIAVVHRV